MKRVKKLSPVKQEHAEKESLHDRTGRDRDAIKRGGIGGKERRVTTAAGSIKIESLILNGKRGAVVPGSEIRAYGAEHLAVLIAAD